MSLDLDSKKRPDKIDKIIEAVNKFASQNDNFIFCTQQKTFYMWLNKYWQPVDLMTFEKWLMDNYEPILYMSRNKRAEAIHNLALIKQKSISDFNNGEFLDFNNGILFFNGDFKNHDKSLFSNIRIPYEYLPSAICPQWIDFLNGCLENNIERINLLQEFIGYCLGKDNSYHKALILIGDGRNGKGTTFHVIKKLLGDVNCTALKIGQMTNENFAARLANKLVNIDADTDSSASKFESDFRRITAGDTILVKNLYSDPFELTPYVRLLIGANELPHIADKTHGLYDRLLIIPYNVNYAGKEDFGLKQKLENELSGILNWTLEGRKRLYNRGRFTETEEMLEIIQEIKRQNNPIQAYIDERIVINSNAGAIKYEVYSDYVAWCKLNNYRALSHIKFSKEFFRICKKWTSMNVRKNTRSDNTHIWPGLHIIGKWEGQQTVDWQE